MCSLFQRFLETLFYHILPVFTVDEVCNNSDKNQPRSNLTKYTFLHKTLYIPPSFRKEISALHRKRFIEKSFILDVRLDSKDASVCCTRF